MREKSKTQSARHSKATVACSTAAKANNDSVRAAIRCIQNHFADAECGRANRIAFVLGDAAHACGFAHFHYGEFFVAIPSVTRVDFATERIVCFAFQPRTAARLG